MTNCPSCGTRLESPAASCSSCGKPLDLSLLATNEQVVAGVERASSHHDFLTPGVVIAGRYRVIEFVGRGGMGEVIRAHDETLDQTVALKFLPANLASDPRALERILTEVRMARLVSHPNVCRVHDLSTTDGQSFISMEYIDGEDLASLLRRVGRLAGNRALEIARELCAGLAAAHAAGVIHRDLKPANIMLDRQGRVRITDFGLAWTSEDSTTKTSEIHGTPAYMAPEQLAGAGATVKSDLYSLGLVLYELLTGQRVFSATTMSELFRQRQEPITPPTHFVHEIDPAVEATILHCLATRPEQRPDSALEVLSALSGGDPLKAALAAGQTPSPSDVARAPVRGTLQPSMAWICVALVLAGIGFFTTNAWRTSVLGRFASPFPAEVLSVKAEEAMRALGYRAACTHKASGFIYNNDALRAAATNSIDPAQRTAAEERTILFWHRCSPVYILPQNMFTEDSPFGEITRGDPPLGPHDAIALLDLNGRLVEYKTLLDDQTSKENVNALLSFTNLAGLDSLSSDPLPVQDGRLSINSKLDGHIPAGAELDFQEGRLSNARVVAPWTKPESPPEMKIFKASDFPDILIFLMTLASIPLAVHNLRAGRGDIRGALRVGLLVFGFYLAGTLILTHHDLPTNYEMRLLVESLSRALHKGITSLLMYLALEPFVRRVWPEALVSWTRLLSGNWRDPLVGRDILIATTASWIVFGLWGVTMMLSKQPELFVLKKYLHSLFGLIQCVASTSVIFALSVRVGLMFLLLLLLLHVFGRIRWFAPVALFLIMVGFMMSILTTDSSTTLLSAGLAVLWGVMVVALLSRVGLLAVIVLVFFGMLQGTLPDAGRLTEWTSLSAWWQAGLAFLVSLYGLYFATGRKPFGQTKLFAA